MSRAKFRGKAIEVTQEGILWGAVTGGLLALSVFLMGANGKKLNAPSPDFWSKLKFLGDFRMH